MEEELNLFFGFLENDKKVSNNTIQSYERDLKKYERYLSEQGKEYKEETNEGIKEYITYMQEIGKKSSTISNSTCSTGTIINISNKIKATIYTDNACGLAISAAFVIKVII